MPSANPTVGFVSLGCPKALVDSERILTQLKLEGYDIVQAYDAADVVVVNTCGFIDSVMDESLGAIGEALAENGRVIVTGCLGRRPERVRQAHPGVLAIGGPQDYASMMAAVHAAAAPRHDLRRPVAGGAPARGGLRGGRQAHAEARCPHHGQRRARPVRRGGACVCLG